MKWGSLAPSFKNCTNAAHTKIEAFLEIDEGSAIPDLTLEFVPGYELSRLKCENRENLGGLRLQPKYLPMFAQFTL
jgi:hypothetical protein